MSLLLATTILAAGGVGLYMCKQDDNQTGGESYNEDSLFSSGSFWGSEATEDETEEPNEEELPVYEYKSRGRQNKTKKNARKSTGTKRRY